MKTEIITIGKRGTVVIPAALRKQFGMQEGDLLITQETDEGILMVPAVALPIEHYSAQRKAEFLLSNAISPEDYEQAREEVRTLGLDPDKVPHYKPHF